MATINELKQRIDLHDLAEKLGLERPQERGNYRSPRHADKNPSLSIYKDGKQFRDWSCDTGGSCIDLVMHVEGCDESAAVRRLHELYDIPPDPPKQARREKSTIEYIADKCRKDTDRAMEYLTGRGIAEEVVARAIKKGTVGYNDYVSPKHQEGEPGYGGPAVTFIVRTLNPGHVVAVDMRYLDPQLNGGMKTKSLGEKMGCVWTSDIARLKKAETVFVVESSINGLSVETCDIPRTAVVATRGTGNVGSIDWRFLQGKRVIFAADDDEPNDYGQCPGAESEWTMYDDMVGLNIAAHFLDKSRWGYNDLNEILQHHGKDVLRARLKEISPYIIPGVPPNKESAKGRSRVYLPGHDYAIYWRYRAKEDFTTFISKVRQDSDTGAETYDFADLCAFRIASISRVTIASATATMSGEEDVQPKTQFAVSVQLARHGNQLRRKVFDDESLTNVDLWGKFDSVFKPTEFKRMLSLLQRTVHLAEKRAVNFVGLAWRDGRLVVNEGPDCYFVDPKRQCPYHNLTFPSGSPADARAVISEYQKTFTNNAGLIPIIWGLGGHMKAFFGYWPHLVMQAEKGAGKSTLIKRMERTLAFTMFGGQSMQSEFRMLTSTSHTSHPVGWEEISARSQMLIDKAVRLLQESYQFAPTNRGTEMLEYLVSAPVLLAGEDVPVKSLTGKLVRTELTAKQGPLMREDLPRFPVLQWLQYLAKYDKRQVNELYTRALDYCQRHNRAGGKDQGAKRMTGNYAALLTAWSLLCDFAGIDRDQGGFVADLVAEMNAHIADTSEDREPWVWIMETIIAEIAAGNYRLPYKVDWVEEHPCLVIRLKNMVHHLRHTISLRDFWNGLPVKSDRALRKQLAHADVIFRDRVDATIGNKRECHLVALSIDALQGYGLPVSTPEDPSGFATEN